MAISGTALAATSVGALFLYGGVTGKSPLAVLLSVVKGNAPSAALQSQGISLGSAQSDSQVSAAAHGAVAGTSSDPHAALSSAAASYGWDTGAEWQALNNIEMHEAGYNPQARNPSSGALGLAQALGHGTAQTAGTLGNEYGGYGLTTAQAQAANSGNPDYQALWMVNYIKSRYGDPIAAWAQYHHADGKNWY